MALAVINSLVSGNPYQKLLYSQISSRYELVAGNVQLASEQQRSSGKSIFHIHWDESVFNRCKDAGQAIRRREDFVDKLERYVAIGGKVVWTLHNVKAHEWKYVNSLYSLRRGLASIAHRILIHNSAAREVLAKQTGLSDFDKVRVLPHPAYLGVYEPEKHTMSLLGSAPSSPRTLIYFGLVRPYKGLMSLVQRLDHDFMVQSSLSLDICGEPFRADALMDDLLTEAEDRPELRCRFAAVPDERVAQLLRSGAGVVIPYHKVLTSGVAVLTLSLGIPTVAPDTPAMRELFPEECRELLFNPRSPKDLRRAVLALVNLSEERRREVATKYYEQAQCFHPDKISLKLGSIYDELLD